MATKTYLTALLQGKCPHCREGNIFTYPVSKISKFNMMNPVCNYCGIRLEPEPGFYQGAMYVGYGFTIGFMILISSILYLLGDFSEWTYVLAVIGFMILVIPLNYRYSRILYLYFFGGIKYDPMTAALKH
jgi:uncharacterized protein (DUF983 family)